VAQVTTEGFVGRREQLALLDEAMGAAQASEPGLVLLNPHLPGRASRSSQSWGTRLDREDLLLAALRAPRREMKEREHAGVRH